MKDNYKDVDYIKLFVFNGNTKLAIKNDVINNGGKPETRYSVWMDKDSLGSFVKICAVSFVSEKMALEFLKRNFSGINEINYKNLRNHNI